MQITVDHLEGLERRIKVTLPADSLAKKAQAQLQKMASQVRIKGFRQKKVPFSEVQKRFGASVYQEVAIEEMKVSLNNILVEKNIAPVVVPNIQVDVIEMGQPLTYVAEFEEYPVVDLIDLKALQVEKLKAEIPQAQVDQLLEDLRRQNAQWKEVDRPAVEGDSVVIDFNGTIEGKEFAGGSAKALRIELGKARMLPDFEKRLVGAKAGQSLLIDLVFPENYSKSLSGKKAVFNTVVLHVLAAELPTDEQLIEKLGFKEGGMQALRAQIIQSAENQVNYLLKQKIKRKVIDNLTEQHNVILPKALIAQELQRLKNQSVAHDHEHDEHCGHDPDQDTLEKNASTDQKMAERHVKQALLLREIMKVYGLAVDQKRVREQLLKFVQPGQDPKQVLAWFYQDKKRYANIEAAVLEEQIVDKILEQAQVTEKLISYEEAIKG